MKRLILVLAVLWPLSLLAGCQAGVDAAKRGDYAAAYRERLPLAEQGDADAQYNLGVMYDTGSGVSQDYVEAFAWLNLAAAQGQTGAAWNRGIVLERMTPAQVDQAQQLSRTLAQQIENRAKAGVPASPAQSDGSALERNYPQGTVMVRIDIRDAKITDFVNPRKFAAGYLGTLANLQGADWSYYEGSSLVRHCVEKSGSLNEECRNSLDLELASLDFTIGVDCTKAQGLRTRKDMQSLLQRFVRESPTEARESGELIGATAFLKYADPRLCPESATAAAARAEREERATRAAGGDAEDQYQLALRKFG
jgi:hypothetical protein